MNQEKKSPAAIPAAACRGLVWLIIPWMLAALAACAATPPAPEPILSRGPVAPWANPFVAPQWYHQWADEPDLAGSSVHEMMLQLYVPDGQGKRPAGQSAGYAFQVVLLNQDSLPLQENGSIDVVLVYQPEQSTAQALAAWSLSAPEVEIRHGKALLPGYMIRLDYPSPVPVGQLMLIVRWNSQQSQARVTRNILFQDNPDYVQSQTPRG